MQLSILSPDYQGGNLHWKNYNPENIVYTADQHTINDLQTKFKTFGFPRAWVNHGWPVCPFEDFDDYYYLPVFIKLIANKLQSQSSQSPWTEPQYCFNFMINKIRINRYLLLRMVEWFKLDSYNYTNAYTGDPINLSIILKNFDCDTFDDVDRNLFQEFVLNYQSVKIPKKFYEYPIPHDEKGRMDQISNWNEIIKPVFLPTVTSLITESNDDTNLSAFSEKTIYAMEAMTFPIWVGGHHSADFWRDYGFDVFDDVVDHGYQNSNSLLERCYLAFKLNKRLLSDFDYACSQKQKMKARLIANQQNMTKIINKFYDQQWNRLPKYVQDLIYSQTLTHPSIRDDV